MKRFRVSHPNEFAILVSLFTAAFGYFFMTAGSSFLGTVSTAVWMRVVYLAAASLLMFDVIEGAYIARVQSRNTRSPHFWIYAFYMGYFWALLMILMFWEGVENIRSLLIQWGLTGAAFGISMAFLTSHDDSNLSDRFDLEKPATGHALGSIYYIWPILLILLITGLIAFPPTQGWGENYLMFQMILLGSLMPLYGYKKDNFWRNLYPRMIGITLLLIGLLAFR